MLIASTALSIFFSFCTASIMSKNRKAIFGKYTIGSMIYLFLLPIALFSSICLCIAKWYIYFFGDVSSGIIDILILPQFVNIPVIILCFLFKNLFNYKEDFDSAFGILEALITAAITLISF